ncbi:MAG TPA: hypothetical protein VHO23_02400 [Candidatus Paceibacterota bacterium]|nr:hypothetical protein [Candidatus Paceibacterota bacterium]
MDTLKRIRPTPKVAPSPEPTPPSRSPRVKGAYRVLGFLAGALIALPVIGLTAVGPVPFDEMKSALTLPYELRDATFLTVTGDQRYILKRAGWWWFEDIDSSDRFMGPIVRTRDGLIASITRDSTMAPQLVVNGVLAASLPPHATGLAVSPDGTKFAYAYLDNADAARFNDPTAWAVGVYDYALQRTFEAARGFAPFFVDDTHLARATAAGVQSLDFATAEYVRLRDTPFVVATPEAERSPDGSLVALANPGLNQTTVYRISPTDLTVVATYPVIISNAALGPNALYEVRALESGTEIWKYPFDGSAPTRIHTFPVSIRVLSLSL